MPIDNSRKTGLSKSQYLRGIQCHKSLYLYKYHRELRDEISESQQAIFSSGTDVGVLAQKLFPGGAEISFDELSIPEQIEKTKQEISKGTQTIYEASFEYDGLFVMVDILNKGENGWELYEVKSSTSVKDINYHDVAFQWHVVTSAGVNLHKAFLVHVDNSYVRDGEVDVEKLFVINDLTNEATMRKSVSANIAKMREVLKGDIPSIDIGKYCSNPYDCDFHGHCWKHLPEDSVFTLRGGGIDKFNFYQHGLISFEDLPLHELKDRHSFQVEMHLTQGEHIDPEGLKDFLDSLWYPLCHLDFETFTSPVPLYDGTRPYQQVPFQYSLHIQHEKGGPIEHHEYLGQPNVDPRLGLIEGMVNEIPIGACVLTYNMSFEKTRLKELIEDFPEHKDGLSNILSGVMDLLVPFRKRYAYRWQQRGSNSIKDVLPAFVPTMSYKDLEISGGGMAMDAYHLMCAANDPGELNTIRKNLLKYCERDTEAMVLLLQCLEDIVTDEFIKAHR